MSGDANLGPLPDCRISPAKSALLDSALLPAALGVPAPRAAASGLTRLDMGTLALLGACWLILINQLRLDWETNPQYSYGWLVPLLAAYLFWVRWPSRPEVLRPRGVGWLALAAVALACALFPTRLIAEATPEWSFVRWSLALEVVGLTLAALAWAGGWPTMRHFAWPIAFFLLGVAWPARFETALTQNLMQHLAAVASELLNWAGVFAEPEGNLIRLGTGVVGVDEACSGVRSLQSMLMASIFLGELNRFSFRGRIGVVLIGLSLALLFNIVRAMLLVTVAVQEGISALGKWHDPAGFTILLLSFAALYLLVRFFRKPLPAVAPLVDASALRPLPGAVLGCFAGWLLLTEATTELWYRAHESVADRRAGWAIRWPEGREGFQTVPISLAVSKVLACNEGREVAWREPGGDQWQMFAFQWYPGRTSTLAARMHRPEVCLPAGGRKLIAELPPTLLEIGSLQIPFRTYQFDNQGRPLFVFFCLWEMGSRDLGESGLSQRYTGASRLSRVLIGKRNLGQQSIEMVLSGPSSPAAAIAAFRDQAREVITAP